MKLRLIAYALLALVLTATAGLAQTNPLRGAEPPVGSPGPDQPVRLQAPTLIQRAAQQPAVQAPAVQQPPPPPFQLTPAEETQLDQMLGQWEKRNANINTFDCRFKRWTYDTVFGPPDKARFIDVGVIKYAAPDRGKFLVEATETDGKEAPVDPARAEHWISDGKSIFEFNIAKRQLIEHVLPPELQGKAIADTPLPFLFGADAKKLKDRYFLRLTTPPQVKNQIWLEAYPRHQQDAANFHHAQFIITSPKMEPYGLEVTQPNGKDRMAYQFFDIVVNDQWRLFKGDPFRAFTPLGWTKVVEQPPRPAGSQARRPAKDVRR